jgi:hypothetical protein
MGIPMAALVPGNKADRVVSELQRAHLVPRVTRGLRLRHQGQGGDFDTATDDGRRIMGAGKAHTMDWEGIVPAGFAPN